MPAAAPLRLVELAIVASSGLHWVRPPAAARVLRAPASVDPAALHAALLDLFHDPPEAPAHGDVQGVALVFQTPQGRVTLRRMAGQRTTGEPADAQARARALGLPASGVHRVLCAPVSARTAAAASRPAGLDRLVRELTEARAQVAALQAEAPLAPPTPLLRDPALWGGAVAGVALLVAGLMAEERARLLALAAPIGFGVLAWRLLRAVDGVEARDTRLRRLEEAETVALARQRQLERANAAQAGRGDEALASAVGGALPPATQTPPGVPTAAAQVLMALGRATTAAPPLFWTSECAAADEAGWAAAEALAATLPVWWLLAAGAPGPRGAPFASDAR